MPATVTSRLSRVLIGFLGAGLLAGGLTGGGPVSAAQDKVVRPAFDPAAPRIMNGRVYGIDTHGDLAVVAGSFTRYREGDGTGERTQQWVFMFNHVTGRIVPGFDPQVAGPAPVTSGVVAPTPGVQAVQFADDGGSVYLAGDFTTVNGDRARRVARVKLNGDLAPNFSASLDQVANDMVLAGGRLIVAGKFVKVNGAPRRRLASLDPRSGALQTDFDLPVTESRYEFAPFVQDLDLSANGRWLAVAGNFRRIDGQTRGQVGLIDLRGNASVADWSTDEYAGYCSDVSEANWVYGVDISPDSRFLVATTTGFYFGPNRLCDTAARFELPGGGVTGDVDPSWVNHTGGDTLWSSEITESAVYVGGHQRWMNNATPTDDGGQQNGDHDGPGAIVRTGIAALDPLTGVPLTFDPGRDRGRGPEAMHTDGQKLFIGHDTDFFAGQLRQRLAVLSTEGGVFNPQPFPRDLPVVFNVREGNDLRRIRFDGRDFGPVTTFSGPGVDGRSWGGFRDGFYQRGQVHYFGPASAFWKRDLDDSSIGDPVNLSATVGYSDANQDVTPFDQPRGVAETQVAAYAPVNGRIYYRTNADSRLYSRGYSLQSGIIGTSVRRETDQSFAGARALSFVQGRLYAAWSDGSLYRFDAVGGDIDFSTRTQIDDGSSGIDWASVGGMFETPASGAAARDTERPGVTILRPRAGATSKAGRTLIRGNAADFVEVAQVRVSVRRLDKPRLWLQRNGRWRAKFGFTPATLSNPGGTQTNWSLRRKLPSGRYRLVVRAQDAAGNLSTIRSRRFSVRLRDAKRPVTAIQRSPGRATRAPATSIVGVARDNQAIARVRVKVSETRVRKGRTVTRWLKPNGRWGGKRRTIDAKVIKPLLRTTKWRLRFKLVKGRTYEVRAFSVDADNKRDRSASRISFRRR